MGLFSDIFGGSSKQKSTSVPVVPSYMQPLLSGQYGAFTQLGQAQGGLPSLTQLALGAPLLNVPGMTAEQQQQLQSLVNQANNNPQMQAALQQLQQLTAGPIGSSPATQQAMAAWQQNVAPQIKQMSALQGTAGGGQALEALQQGQTGALVPLLQTEIANRQQAANQYLGLGQAQMNNLAMALEASGLPRDVALQQAQALYNQQLQNLQNQWNLQTFPLGLAGQLIGQQTTSKTTQTPSIGGVIGNTVLGGLMGNMLAGNPLGFDGLASGGGGGGNIFGNAFGGLSLFE